VQFGVRYAVATLGTATTHDHLETLFRVVPRVIFCFDGDRAGRDAAWRALENTLPVMHEGREAAFLFLPDGQDPDSMIREEGTEAFEQRVQSAIPLSSFMIDHLSQQVNVDTPDGRARLVKLTRPLLDTIPDKVFRHLLYDQLAQRVHMKTDQLESLVDHAPASTESSQPNQPSSSGKQTPVRKAINLLLQSPPLAAAIKDYAFLAKSGLPGATLLFNLLELMQREPHLNTAALLERWRDKAEGKHLFKLAETLLPGSDEDLQQELVDIILYLRDQMNIQRWHQLQEKLAVSGLNDDELLEWNQLLTGNNESS